MPRIGSRASDPVGFHDKAATVQRTSANQAAVTGTVGAAVATTGATNSSPYGFTGATQADRLVALVNELRADSLAQTILINELRTALVNKGLIKGAA